MPFVYLDYNFLASAHDSDAAYRTRLRAVSQRVTFILSAWHHVEMARDDDEKRSYSVADFADALNPMWLSERRSLVLREFRVQLFLSRGIWYDIQPPIGTLREMEADVLNTSPSVTPTRSVDVVRAMRHLGPDHPLEQTFRDAFKGQEQNRRSYRYGEIKPLNSKYWNQVVIRGFMRAKTSPQASQPFDERLINEYAPICRIELFPALALEVAVSRESWKLNRALSENEFLDRQHMVALPYVDLFVTDDRRMTKTLNRAVPRLACRTAEIIKKTEFDSRFLA